MTAAPEEHLYLCRAAWPAGWGDPQTVHATKRRFYTILHQLHKRGFRVIAPISLEVEVGAHIWVTKVVGPQVDNPHLVPVELGDVQPRIILRHKQNHEEEVAA